MTCNIEICRQLTFLSSLLTSIPAAFFLAFFLVSIERVHDVIDDVDHQWRSNKGEGTIGAHIINYTDASLGTGHNL